MTTLGGQSLFGGKLLYDPTKHPANGGTFLYLSGPITLIFGFFHFRVFSKYFWLGGAAPQTPQFLAGGAKPPQTPP